MDDDQFRQLLNSFHLSWQGYRKVRKGVKKRIARHMQSLDCRHVEAYLDRLARDEALKDTCRYLLTVPISRFFRDRALWQQMQDQVLPSLIRRWPDTLKVWSAGCAAGEEVYSFLILWKKLATTAGRMPFLQMIASDLDAERLNRAREGIYRQSSLKEVGKADRERFFDKLSGKKSFAVNLELKTAVTWIRHDLLTTPPACGFHLIFMRNNVLTYYADALKIPAAVRIVDCLVSHGILAIGAHERLPAEVSGLQKMAVSPHLLKKS